MNKRTFISTTLLCCTTICFCQKSTQSIIARAEMQTKNMIAEMNGKILLPRTTEYDTIQYVNIKDWTSGFFPGTLWYLYELTEKTSWEIEAKRFTETLESIQNFTGHHDVGFMMMCSYGNGFRLGEHPSYAPIIIQSAHSLSTRFRPSAGIIQSWDISPRKITQGLICPVIIDNMMNLELLYEATKLSGDSSFYKIATSHADKTLENHYRFDYSCYHLVDYNPEDGSIHRKQTVQGYADSSAWARGQAWGLYGFTMCYRYTGDRRYLDQAIHIANFISTHQCLPKDNVPYWDFDAPDIPNAPRDVSAAAIMASALYELAQYSDNTYSKWADKILKSLCSKDYLAKIGTNHGFLLMHSVGNKPRNIEVDVPLNYADYYFLEALIRQKRFKNHQNVIE